MKNLLAILCAVFIIFSFVGNTAFAHPGRTDSNGGHTCRTNCEKWGLQYGEYHYHNGGNSTSSSNSGTTRPKSNSSPQPSYSQEDVNKGRESGKTQGYNDGYSRTSKNAKTTTGNEGYQKGYAAGYEAGYNEGLKKIQEEDTMAGTTSGKEEGKAAYKKEENNEVSTDTTKSDEWNNAYKAAFIESYNREKAIDHAGKSGHALGYELAELEIPGEFAQDETLKTTFEAHYKKGHEKRMHEETDKHIKLGSDDGYALLALATATLDERFIDSYKKGYEEGKLKRKEETIEEGYQAAFVHMDYQEPKRNSDKELIEWYREGYESNEIATQIKETAFENGYNQSKYSIPEEFTVNEQSIALYDSLFQEGQDLKAQEKRKKMSYVAGFGIPAGGIAVGGYFWRKRKKKMMK